MRELFASEARVMKLVRLRWDGTRVEFAPVYRRRRARRSVGNDATAVCDVDESHNAPEWGCNCGFHGVRNEEELWRAGEETWGVVRAEASFAGRMVEHAHGWRAAWQRIETLWLPAACAWCRGATTGVSRARRGEMWPTCGGCGGGFMTPRDLSIQLHCVVNLAGGGPSVGFSEVRRARNWARVGVAASVLLGVMLAFLTREPAWVCLGGGLGVLWDTAAVAGAERYLIGRGLAEAERRSVLGSVKSDSLWLAMTGWVIAGAVGFML